jgi:hypothetical protein
MIKERNRAYETLIRHNEDGSISAHHQTINEVVKDGQVTAASVSAPMQLESVAAELEPIIGEALIAAVADADRLRQLCVEKDSQLAELGRQLNELKNLLDAGKEP